MRDLGDIYPRSVVELRTISGGVVFSKSFQATISIGLSGLIRRIDGIAKMRTAILIEDHVLPCLRLDRVVSGAEVEAGRKEANGLAQAAPVTVRRMAIARATP